MEVLNADDLVLDRRKFKINKSDKLLNSIFNTLAKSYARNKNIAFKRTLKQLEFSDYLVEYFPMPDDDN